MANPHGDIVTTITLPTTGNALAIGAWADYDEYGNPLPPAGATTTAQTLANAATVAGPGGYGWVGAKQRATNPDTGLILMGARVYNTVTGAFTSRDPVYGGNTTAYTYPQDPTNGYDLNGQWGWGWLSTAASAVASVASRAWDYAKRNPWDVVATAASFIPITAGFAWGYRAYRIVRLASVAKGSVNGVLRTRATSWLAGRMRTGRGAIPSFAHNGARQLTGKIGRTWRGPSKSGKGWKSNFEFGAKGHHTYSNYHVNHRPPRRWAPWW